MLLNALLSGTADIKQIHIQMYVQMQMLRPHPPFPRVIRIPIWIHIYVPNPSSQLACTQVYVFGLQYH